MRWSNWKQRRVNGVFKRWVTGFEDYVDCYLIVDGVIEGEHIHY